MFPWTNLSHPLPLKRHLDRFSRFCNRHVTDHATPCTPSVATGRILSFLSPVHASNNVEATLSKQRSTLSKGRNFNAKLVRHCCRFWQQSRTLLRHCCQKRQQCRSNVRHCRSNIRHCSIRQCCFDIVASVDRALCAECMRCDLTKWRPLSRTETARLSNRSTVVACASETVVGWRAY